MYSILIKRLYYLLLCSDNSYLNRFNLNNLKVFGVLNLNNEIKLSQFSNINFSSIRIAQAYIYYTVRNNITNNLYINNIIPQASILYNRLYTMYTYNHAQLHLQLTRISLFFYHMGRARASFAVLTTQTLWHEARALMYHTFKTNQRLSILSDLLNTINNDSFNIMLTHRNLANIDFIYIVNSSMTPGMLSRLGNLGIHLVGVSQNITWARYIDTIIPLETISLELQYYFLELALNLYLRGTRDSIYSDLNTCVNIFQNLL
jgi:hypothetical protein